MSATLLTHGPPSNIRGGIEARAPKRKASPDCISVTITLVVPFVLDLQVLRGIDISPTAMLESMDDAERFVIRVDGGSFPR